MIIFSCLNELGSQGLSATIFIVRDKIEATIKKLKLWLDCMNNNRTEVFASANQLQTNITAHLSELAAQLRRYFPETDKSDSWTGYPFSACLLPCLHLNRRASLMSQQVDP